MHLHRDLKQISKYPHDLLIIGGGLTGACIARDAAMRGLRVALVEAQDFAQDAGAAGAKSVHNAVRFVHDRDFSDIRTGLRERHIWKTIAPHLVLHESLLVPVYSAERRDFARLRRALRLSEWLAPFELKHGHTTKDATAVKLLDGEEVLRQADLLKERNLLGGLSLPDCSLTSPERMALECLLSAVEYGAQVINYVTVTKIWRSGSGVSGAYVYDALTGENATIKADLVINAAGTNADEIARMGAGAETSFKLVRVKTLQMVTRPITEDFGFAVAGEQGDYVFALPLFHNHLGRFSLVGASLNEVSTGAACDLAAEQPDEAATHDLAAALDKINQEIPGALLKPEDVLQVCAGTRCLVDRQDVKPFARTPVPLPQATRATADPVSDGPGGPPSEPPALQTSSSPPPPPAYSQSDPLLAEPPLSGENLARLANGRQWEIHDHDKDGVSGFVSVVGDGWMLARHIADQVVNLALRKLKKPKQASRTDKQPVYGGHLEDFEHYVEVAQDRHGDLPPDVVENLIRTYGSHYRRIMSYLDETPGLLSPHTSDIEAQVRYAVNHEMAVQLEDVVLRRTGLGALSHPGDDVLRRTAQIMAEELAWTDAYVAEQILATNKALAARNLKPAEGADEE